MTQSYKLLAKLLSTLAKHAAIIQSWVLQLFHLVKCDGVSELITSIQALVIGSSLVWHLQVHLLNQIIFHLLPGGWCTNGSWYADTENGIDIDEVCQASPGEIVELHLNCDRGVLQVRIPAKKFVYDGTVPKNQPLVPWFQLYQPSNQLTLLD